MNRLIRVTVADPLRRHTTWYGYDHNGRIDSVWTAVDTVGSGTLLHGQPNNWSFERYVQPRPAEPVITYSYTPSGKVDTMHYPEIGVATAYSYNARKWLDTLVASKGQTDIFRQHLRYDAAGYITEQYSKHDGSAGLAQEYGYDNIGRLKTWKRNPWDPQTASARTRRTRRPARTS